MRIERGGVPGIASPIVIDGKRQVADAPSPRLDSASGAEFDELRNDARTTTCNPFGHHLTGLPHSSGTVAAEGFR